MPDIGGRIRNAGIRDIFEEGLQIPQLKLINAGKPDQNLFDMIGQNVRVPEQTLGDIWAQVAACKMLEERLLVRGWEDHLPSGRHAKRIESWTAWAERNDARNYAVLGDPVVRLRIDALDGASGKGAAG